jgi:hypothetical protein
LANALCLAVCTGSIPVSLPPISDAFASSSVADEVDLFTAAVMERETGRRIGNVEFRMVAAKSAQTGEPEKN